MYYSSSNKILNNGFIITHTLWIDSVTVSEFKHLHEVLYKELGNIVLMLRCLPLIKLATLQSQQEPGMVKGQREPSVPVP